MAPQPDSRAAARLIPSPNHGERRDGAEPDMLVLHYTGLPDEDEALHWLCNPASEVSAHYFVFANGHVVQLVPEARRAWHAGVASWAGDSDVNSRSIGIEIAHPGHAGGLPPFGEGQLAGVIALAREIVARRAIRPERVLAHSDVAPGRKQDPGELFPWRRLHEAGVGHWVHPAPLRNGRVLARGDSGAPVETVQAMLAEYGYGVPVDGRFEGATEDVVAAFQRHFRPQRIDGIADPSTITTLRDLLAGRTPVVA